MEQEIKYRDRGVIFKKRMEKDDKKSAELPGYLWRGLCQLPNPR
jgi:hypothetical protein